MKLSISRWTSSDGQTVIDLSRVDAYRVGSQRISDEPTLFICVHGIEWEFIGEQKDSLLKALARYEKELVQDEKDHEAFILDALNDSHD